MALASSSVVPHGPTSYHTEPAGHLEGKDLTEEGDRHYRLAA